MIKKAKARRFTRAGYQIKQDDRTDHLDKVTATIIHF